MRRGIIRGRIRVSLGCFVCGSWFRDYERRMVR